MDKQNVTALSQAAPSRLEKLAGDFCRAFDAGSLDMAAARMLFGEALGETGLRDPENSLRVNLPAAPSPVASPADDHGEAMEIPPPEFTGGFEAGIDFALTGITHGKRKQVGKFDAWKKFQLESPPTAPAREPAALPADKGPVTLYDVMSLHGSNADSLRQTVSNTTNPSALGEPEAMRVVEHMGQWWIMDGDRMIAMCTREGDARRLARESAALDIREAARQAISGALTYMFSTTGAEDADFVLERLSEAGITVSRAEVPLNGSGETPSPTAPRSEIREVGEIHLTETHLAMMGEIISHWKQYQRRDVVKPGSSYALESLSAAEDAFRELLTSVSESVTEGNRPNPSPSPSPVVPPVEAPKAVIRFPSVPPYNIHNQPLTWLYTHCRAIGMTEKAEDPSAEGDICLFTMNLKARAEKAERELEAMRAPKEDPSHG